MLNWIGTHARQSVDLFGHAHRAEFCRHRATNSTSKHRGRQHGTKLAEHRFIDHAAQLRFHAELAELQGLAGENAVKNRSRIVAFRTIVSAQTVRPTSPVQVREVIAPPERKEPPSNAGWIVVGVTSLSLSALAGVTSIIVNNQLQDPISRFESAQQRNDPSGNAILKDEIEPKQTFGRIMTITSGVLGVAGAAMLLYGILGTGGDSDDTISMTPTGVMVRY